MKDDKMHTTNYHNTFIEVAEDTKVVCGTAPLSKGDKKTVAALQYEILVNNPYKFSSDDLFFKVYAIRNDITKEESDAVRKQFFSKGQPCFRSSPLTKAYGFGVHSDEHCKVAIYGMETAQYEAFVNEPGMKKVKAMRTSKK
jgi:cytochrome c biogenesis protein ResB